MNAALYLAAMLVAVSVPYLFERFRYGIRFGLFAILFWLFVAQWALIGIMLLVTEVLGTESLVGTLAGIIAGLALFATGFIPFIALPISLVVVLGMMGWKWFKG